MGATFNNNVIVNILKAAGAVARAEFGLICYGSTDTTFAAGVHKIFETITAVNDDTELSAPAKAAGADFFRQDNHPPRFMVCEMTDDTTPGDLADSLDTALLAQSFYCLTMQLKVEADILAADLWVALNYVQGWFQSSDAPFLAGTAGNVGEDLQTADTGRSLVFYHATDTAELAVAMAAEYFFADPDNQVTTLAYQQVSGFTPDDIDGTEKANVLGVNGNLYLPMGGQNVCYGGTMASGDFVDQVLSGDWFAARVREGAQQLLIDKAALKTKVPYTQSGMEQFGAVISAVQQRGETMGEGPDSGHFQEDLGTVTVPKLADVPVATRATRGLTIVGKSTLTGAIQTVTANITVLNA